MMQFTGRLDIIQKMNKFSNIIFDLDGTLVDSQKDIFLSFKEALNSKFGLIIDNISFKIGPPLEDIVSSYFKDISPEDLKSFISEFRLIYRNCGFNNTFCYEGIANLLTVLKRVQKKMFIATNKPGYLTTEIVSKLNIDYFDEIITIDSIDGLLLSKKEMISLLIENNKLDTRFTVMIGDSFTDISSAKYNSIYSIGVGYGYEAKDQIQKADPDYFFDTVLQLRHFLTGK
jgi:phosphoglycolate phosphatase